MVAVILALAGCSSPAPEQHSRLTPELLASVGERIFANECGGKVENLVAWNQGEDFPSLGIGHFIWYPAGVQAPFQESFPEFLVFVVAQGVVPPEGLHPDDDAWWSTRQDFLQAQAEHDPRMLGLRSWLNEHRALQVQFIAQRMQAGLSKLLSAVPHAEQQPIAQRWQGLADTACGLYTLIDYTNFKGEGVLPSERYQEQGWGVLQVLEHMPGAATPEGFADTAAEVLKQRVANAPAERHEERWLRGWLNRLDTYRQCQAGG